MNQLHFIKTLKYSMRLLYMYFCTMVAHMGPKHVTKYNNM